MKINFLILSTALLISSLTTQLHAQSLMAVPDGHGKSRVVNIPAADSSITYTFKTKTIDYGKIAHYSNGTKYFYYTNTGKKPLVIQTVTSSCGCTVPQWDSKPLLPGKTARITVKYDTERVGYFTRTLQVVSSSSTPNVMLTIKGSVSEEPKTLAKGKKAFDHNK